MTGDVDTSRGMTKTALISDNKKTGQPI